ncbi:MAG: hypothetical protein HYY84_16570 [Deltaproteobacteria bacterium]|nr:hypothetical protein [Deltaproteobacteria bacterium]
MLQKGKRTYLVLTGKGVSTHEAVTNKYQLKRLAFDKLELRRVGASVRFQMEREVDDCRKNGCEAGRNCQICWHVFACIPEHAMC